MADIRVMATGLRFPEGPVAMADGSVILGEIAGGAVTRVAPDGTKSTVSATGGGPKSLRGSPPVHSFGEGTMSKLTTNDRTAMALYGRSPQDADGWAKISAILMPLFAEVRSCSLGAPPMPPVFGVTGATGAQVIGLGCEVLVTPHDGVFAAACAANAMPDPTLRTRASPAAATLRAGATDAI